MKNEFFFTFFLLDILMSGYVHADYLQADMTPITKQLIPIICDGLPSGINAIDAIYMINLDRRTDRLAHMTHLLDCHQLHANRVNAIDGEQLSDEIIAKLVGPYNKSCLMRYHYGTTGCLLSHISVAYDAYKRDFNCIWVMEDDIEIIGDLNQIPQLLHQLSAIDPDWDIFYTDPDFRKNTVEYLFPRQSPLVRPDQPTIHLGMTKRKIRQDGDEIDRVFFRWGTHSMIISKHGLKKMVDHFLHVYLYTPIDVDLHLISGIREYSAVNPIVVNGLNFGTDIRKRKRKK